MTEIFSVNISFGDCDPAGIVFYPNYFRWIDAAFHYRLHAFGGHAAICKKLDALGIGLASSSAQFHTPLRNSDVLEIELSIAEWSKRAVTLSYEGTVGGRKAFSGQEVRCLFQKGEKGIIAGDISALRSILEGQDG